MFASFLFLFLLLINPFLNHPTTTPTGEEDGIVWTTNRRLNWDDFKSQADQAQPLHAMTSTNIAVKAHCSGNQMRFDVKCIFVTKHSWTKNRLSKRLLDHEQLHFDLTEIHARLLRQKLSETNNMCGGERVKLDKLVESYFEAWKKEQNRYDEETNHGLVEEKQKWWTSDIAHRLAYLEPYSYKTYAMK
jgi:hypothetical protein